MIYINEALLIHDKLIERFGGSNGVREMDLLDAAINRPFATFGGQDLYVDEVEKTAAIIESIVKNHPFIDGNKRSGYVLMRLLLLESNFDIEATREEKYDFVISIAEGKLNIDGIKSWLRTRLKKIE